jgi:dTDP-4-dehydrorhamnose reductase
MLGQACVEHLRRDGALHVDTTDRTATSGDRRIDVTEDLTPLWSQLDRARYDLIINAIGVLRSAITDDSASIRNALLVNAVFPHELAARSAAAGARLIHISTDAVFSGRTGAPYDEAAPASPVDRYGASKWLGEPQAATTMTVRCSIVGRSRRQEGLIDWFLGLQPGAHVRAFTDYRWTPTTTFQLVRLIRRLAARDLFDRLRGLSPVFHFAPNPPTTKWAMIDDLNALRQRDVQVEPVAHPAGPSDLSLTTKFDAFRELAADARPWTAVLSEVTQ